jgi:GNAT superfamily N-acetyltransferase
MQTIITSYLQMLNLADFKPSYIQDSKLTIIEMCEPLPDYYRFLYGTVGRDYRWVDRLVWLEEQLENYLSSPAVSIWVAYYNGTPAGYIELNRDSHEPGTEIAYFGLIPRFQGRGIGKHLLSYGIQRAWEEKPVRLWVHTCTLDGPYALPNYQKRGLSIYKQIEEPSTQIVNNPD